MFSFACVVSIQAWPDDPILEQGVPYCKQGGRRRGGPGQAFALACFADRKGERVLPAEQPSRSWFFHRSKGVGKNVAWAVEMPPLFRVAGAGVLAVSMLSLARILAVTYLLQRKMRRSTHH
jgi:hypothetical protein